MGMDVTAVGGIGFVIDLRKIENEDHREHMREFYHLSNEDDPMIYERIGSFDDSGNGVFVGLGMTSDWNDDIDETAGVSIEGHNEMRDTVLNFVEAIEFEDGTNAGQYVDPANFGLHVAVEVNN